MSTQFSYKDVMNNMKLLAVSKPLYIYHGFYTLNTFKIIWEDQVMG